MKTQTRRNFLAGAVGLLGLGGVAAWLGRNDILRWALRRTSNDGLALSPAPALADDTCVLTSSQVEGPFFIAAPIRADIREDRQGKEMILRIKLLRMPECLPLEGAVVELWHCDAEGTYSGYPEDISHDPWKTLRLIGIHGDPVAPLNEKRFLRGAQVADAGGEVEFRTIFPGWYEPRAPHIHFKVLIDAQEQLTSQFYFEPEFCNRIYRQGPAYRAYGECPYTPRNDVAISGQLQAQGLLLTPSWTDDLPLTASARVGIRKSA
ncbi:MAG TPA: hypothetical protein VGB99_02435 [Acidobacteriota bacterium]